VKWSDSRPFEAQAELVLTQLKASQWSLAVTPPGQDSLTLLVNATLCDGVWSGTAEPDSSGQVWFLAFSTVQRPESGKQYLYGLFLQPVGSPGGFGQEQGTWGAEEDDPLGGCGG
jgi:hypothetical protein